MTLLRLGLLCVIFVIMAMTYQNHVPNGALMLVNFLPLLYPTLVILLYPRLNRLWMRTLSVGAFFTTLMQGNFQISLFYGWAGLEDRAQTYHAVALWAPLYSLMVGGFVTLAIYIVLRIKLARNEKI